MFNETSMWVFLAEGDSIYCETKKDIQDAKTSIQNLYRLTGKETPVQETDAPCYLIKDVDTHLFRKNPRENKDIYLLSDFDLLSGM